MRIYNNHLRIKNAFYGNHIRSFDLIRYQNIIKIYLTPFYLLLWRYSSKKLQKSSWCNLKGIFVTWSRQISFKKQRGDGKITQQSIWIVMVCNIVGLYNITWVLWFSNQYRRNCNHFSNCFTDTISIPNNDQFWNKRYYHITIYIWMLVSTW